MRLRLRVIFIALLIMIGGLALIFVASRVSQAPAPAVPMGTPGPSDYDWSTDNEAVPPGDWDGMLLFQNPPSIISRSPTSHQGTYGYSHFSDCAHSTCWASTYITCSVPITAGYYGSWVRFHNLPGIGVLRYAIGVAGEFLSAGDGNVNAPADIEAWTISYHSPSAKMAVTCWVCGDPLGTDWLLDFPVMDTYQHYEVEWDLPCGSSSGMLRAWMDEILYVDETSLTTDACNPAYPDIDYAAAGIKDWHYWWGGGSTIWVDDVTIYPCDEATPTPTPTPSPLDRCDQYGHSSVINIDDDCQGVIRFRTLPYYIPGGAVISRATLQIYGVAAEELGETIYVTPLNALWGEMTTDWCRRLVGTSWGLPGAWNIPLDREPGTIANFETELGWIDIDLPVGLVEAWALTGKANPGLIFHNSDLTGKFSIASREWHVTEEYQPRIVVWYTS